MPVRVQTPEGIHEFPDGTTPEEIDAILGAEPAQAADDSPAAKALTAMLRAKGRSEDDIRKDMGTFAEMDRGMTAALPAEMAIVGGALGGAPGAGLGAYTGHRARGDSVPVSVIGGGVQAAIPGAMSWAAGKAPALVQRAAKPAMRALRRRAGLEGETPDGVAKSVSRFILDHGLKSADDAAKLVSATEKELQATVKDGPAIDVPERVPRYLNKLARRVEKQMTPGQDRAAIQNFGRELMTDSPLSKPGAPSPDPTSPTLEEALIRILNEARNLGRKMPSPATVTGPSASYGSGAARVLRDDISPAEGLSIVRAKSFFNKDASGASIAAGKTAERAVRDGVKKSVPAARPLLRRQGRAMDAEQVLAQMAVREGNRDAVGLPAFVTAGPEIAAGKVPLLGLLSQLLREGQFAAGHAAHKLGKAADPVSRLLALLQSSGGE